MSGLRRVEVEPWMRKWCPIENKELGACCSLYDMHEGPCQFNRAKEFIEIGTRKIAAHPVRLMTEILTQNSETLVAIRNMQLEVRDLKRTVIGLEQHIRKLELAAPKDEHLALPAPDEKKDHTHDA